MILPKSEGKADFAGIDNYYYIIRSDLNVYMRSSNFKDAGDLEIFTLHQACRNGEHYLGHEDGYFYIIKSNHYRRVTDMSTDENPVVSSIHPSCQGGDHYLSSFDYFYIIYQHLGVYRKTKCLHTNSNASEFPLHPECHNGLYYWGIKDYYYFLRFNERWGVEYVRCIDFELNKVDKVCSVHESVINFLPGGLAITMGPAYGQWECIKSMQNDSQTPIEWKKAVTKKVGYEKEKMSTIEHNWNIKVSAKVQAGGLSSLITKATFSFGTEYGGKSEDTSKESWSEATEVEETVSATVQPHQAVYIYVYKLGLGTEPVLHCRDMKILNSPEPPSYSPMPPAKN